ncbi:hypothetical protein DFA_08442 [Cavenderia fasciculata]|uniref:Uncharacterized protein n=1 Tax=Cavenderia fasciculata TaxID=261658 RepID=F4Q673_CACFS|nr:uncharacterized protein DFA_08442 [Cavenderia fasciculata]EGG17447.1 hypothetical protein DFA_08442 [Cavenderia fasciculata]|eukprot:XP_004355931.1 hypothetical protein DFA_08442 [Cavenderia fasciculata]
MYYTSIDSNGDIVCLLLTCKKLYYNSALKRSIQFKGIRPINDRVTTTTTTTTSLFNINSFKDILENRGGGSADQLAKGKKVKATSLELVLVDSDTLSLIEELVIDNGEDEETIVDLGSISQLTRLRHLSVKAHKLILGPHPTLKSLTLDTFYDIDLESTKFVSLTELTFDSYFSGFRRGIFPSSLTHLTVKPGEIPPRDTFLSLMSLEYLDIDLQGVSMDDEDDDDDDNDDDEDERKEFLDLESLPNLKTLTIFDDNTYNYGLEISMPPSIEILLLHAECPRIPHRCPMPLLYDLYAPQSMLIGGRISLASSPLLKELTIDLCVEPMPADFIVPSSVNNLAFIKYADEEQILEHFVLPPTLTELSMHAEYEPVQQFPESLIKLTKTINQDALPLPLPRQLKKLKCKSDGRDDGPSDSDKPESVLSLDYPSSLEKLNLIDVPWGYTLGTIENIPSVKNLLIALRQPEKPWEISDYPIFSIASRISFGTDQPPSQQQQQWLSPNTTHLTCRFITRQTKCLFRLDQIINHTNVRYLSIQIDDRRNHDKQPFQFSIQRLDPDNNNVLVLETKSLQGGIITQQRKTINAQQQHRNDPIYLYFDSNQSKSESKIGSYQSVSPDAYVFKWSFEPLWKDQPQTSTHHKVITKKTKNK